MTNPDGVSALVARAREAADDWGRVGAVGLADVVRELCDALSRSPSVRVDDTIVSVANEVAPQLDKALNDFLNPDVPGPVRANLQAVLWDNKVGILRVLQAALTKATP